MTVEGLTAAVLDFQRQYDFDFVKFMSTGTYSIMDWGADTTWEPNVRGVRTVVGLPVSGWEDWHSLSPLDVRRGFLGQVNVALEETLLGVGSETPVLQTIFSPLSTARKLAGSAALAHIRQHPADLEAGMEVIATNTERMIEAALACGAGIFYAVQSGTADILTADEFQRWETTYAHRVLGGLAADALVILHSHGDHLWFDELGSWPASALNWHDRTAGPSLAEARQHSDRSLVGGLDAYGLLRTGTIAEVQAQVRDAIVQVDRGLIVAPGCVIASDSAPHLIRAARQAVERAPASGGNSDQPGRRIGGW